MTMEELRVRVPELNDYLKYIPDNLNDRYWLHTYQAGNINNNKDKTSEYFSIVSE